MLNEFTRSKQIMLYLFNNKSYYIYFNKGV